MAIASQQYNIMPWESQPGVEKKLQIGILIGLLLVVLFSLVMSSIDLPEEENEEIPERFAKLIVPEKPKPLPKPIPVPEKPKKDAPKDEPKDKPEPVKPKTKVPPPANEQVAKAREVAKQTGILKNSQALQSLQNMGLGDSFASTGSPLISSGESKRKVYVGADLNTDLTAGSGDINTDQYTNSKGVQVSLGERGTTQVKGNKIKAKGAAKPSRSTAKTARGGRSNQQIYQANQRIKGSLDRVYNKARRSNPGLEGTVKFRLTLNEQGRVISAKIVSSTLGDAALEQKLISRIKLGNFGPGIKETIQFSIKFTP